MDFVALMEFNDLMDFVDLMVFVSLIRFTNYLMSSMSSCQDEIFIDIRIAHFSLDLGTSHTAALMVVARAQADHKFHNFDSALVENSKPIDQLICSCHHSIGDACTLLGRQLCSSLYCPRRSSSSRGRTRIIIRTLCD